MYIKTKKQARKYAIDFQNWSSQKNLSYAEVLVFQNKLQKIGKKFHLIKEFKENGLI